MMQVTVQERLDAAGNAALFQEGTLGKVGEI